MGFSGHGTGNANFGKINMTIYKIEAQGDTVYVEAETEEIAVLRLAEKIGPVPRRLLTIAPVEALPVGEELL